MGGLSAAIHAKMKGYDVTVYEKSKQPGGKAAPIYDSGYKFDPGPSIIILTQIYRELFELAGAEFDKEVTLERLDPIFTIQTQDRRVIKLAAGEKSFINSIRKEFPEDEEGVKHLLKLGESVYPFVFNTIFKNTISSPIDLFSIETIKLLGKLELLRNYKSLIDKYIKSPVLRAFYYGFPSYTGQDYLTSSPSGVMMPYIMVRDGVFYPTGGVSKIIDATYELAKKIGVNFRFEHEVKEISTNQNNINKIVFSNGIEEATEYVISNIDPFYIGKLLGRNYNNLETNYSYYTLQIGYRGKIDVDSHHVVLIPEDYQNSYKQLYREQRVPDEPLIYINVPSMIDKSISPDGRTNAFFVMSSPGNVRSIDWKKQKNSALDFVITNLKKYGINLDPKLIEVSRIQTPLYFQNVHNNFLGSLYGSHYKHWTLMGSFPNTNFDRKYKNLTYAGGAVQPGAGLPMAVLSGKFATSRL